MDMISKKSEPLVLAHEMLILDAHLEQVLDHSNRQPITRNLIQDLLKALRMEELGPLAMYDATDLRAPGWSFVQPITTSHISGHYFEKPGTPNIHMDVYSCKPFDWKEAIGIVHKHLQLADWQGNLVNRGINTCDRSSMRLVGNRNIINEEVALFYAIQPINAVKTPKEKVNRQLH